jgi:hypothetical protein
VYDLTCGGGSHQEWTLQTAGGGAVLIVLRVNGHCLQGNDEGAVYTTTCKGTQIQLWTVTATGGADVFTEVGTGLCLGTKPNAYMRALPCASGDSHLRWHVG